MTSKSQLKSLIASTIIASIILGGAAGGAVGALSGSILAGKFVIQPAGENSQNITKEQPQIEKNDNIETDTEIVKIVEQSLPAVVSIIATQELQTLPRSSFFDDFFFGFPFNSPFEQQPQQPQEPKTEKRQVGSGSGFIVSSDGLVVTNRHVVENNQADYSVVLSSGKTYQAEVLDRDTVQDLAVVKINPSKEEGGEVKFSTLELGESSQVKIGQTVLAIGNTLGEFRNTVTRGIVSGINRTLTAGGYGTQSELIEGAIQTDAAISSGNSGGPLLNLSGQVIGVNTAVSQQGENIGFALPIDQVKLILDSIQKHGKIVRPFLGVRYLMLNQDIVEKNNMKIKEGALIVRGETRDELAVTPGSPADKAGLRENDIILEVNGKKISEGQSLQSALSKYQAGDAVKLKVYRAGEEMEVDVKLADRGEF